MSRPGWIRQAWADTSVGLRWTAIVMWVTALAGTGVGALGDVDGWWNRWPFMINLASEVAAGLFGVPIALIVLQRITVAEAGRLERRAAIQFARLAAESLLTEVSGLSPQPAALTDLVPTLTSLNDQLVPAVEHRVYDTQMERILTAWQRAHALWAVAATDRPHADLILSRAGSQWRFFYEHVGPQLLRHGVMWTMTSGTDALSRMLAAVARDYRCRDDSDIAVERAIDMAIAARSMTPLTALYGDGADEVLTGIGADIDSMLTGVRATAVLLSAATDLAASMRAAT